MTAIEMDDDLRTFAKRNGFLVGDKPEPHIYRTYGLRRTSVTVRITVGEVHRNVLFNDSHTRVMEIVGGDGRQFIRSGSLGGSIGNPGADVLRRAGSVMDQMETVSELRNLRDEDQIREALSHLGYWAIQVIRVDLGLPRSDTGEIHNIEIVDRLMGRH